ncbi:hypothetical protein EVAR_81769_1 [Eumeta japonica]|uniref:Uncharacterized protein n=1 Tax=Eumeta variegata TaxID=151549 RepID=A0A4C1UIW5_EUMVA|nr:hypothetical protein EVAR_81769_1 [Eumeta japonica]
MFARLLRADGFVSLAAIETFQPEIRDCGRVRLGSVTVTIMWHRPLLRRSYKIVVLALNSFADGPRYIFVTFCSAFIAKKNNCIDLRMSLKISQRHGSCGPELACPLSPMA